MALTPAACDPNRKSILSKMREAKGDTGADELKQDWNLDVKAGDEVPDIKDTVVKNDPLSKSGNKSK